MQDTSKIRNIAIIAHIEHGKTTLIDSVFGRLRFSDRTRASKSGSWITKRSSGERGITIRAKHCTVTWGDYHINIIDTPGSCRFSGEVERVLSRWIRSFCLSTQTKGRCPQPGTS
jgi:GTP-binding protein